MERSSRVLGKARRTIGGPVVDEETSVPKTPTKSTLKKEQDHVPSGSIASQSNGSVPMKEDSINDIQLASPFYQHTLPDIILSDADTLDGIPLENRTPSPLKFTADTPKESENESQTPAEAFACPICNEMMVSLLQLNRHIDDVHSTPSPQPPTPTPKLSTPNEELRSWLRRTTEVGSKLQTALPKKFVANLDIFDNSASMESSRNSSSTSLSTQQPEIAVTRKHWIKPQQNASCSFDDCRKRLNVKNGVVNCRRCGKLFCNEHSLFRVRLNSRAEYDYSGVWCRCCETCFKNKPGYNDFGTVSDLTSEFRTKRQSMINEKQLYENKLHKRIINLNKAFKNIDYELRNERIFFKAKSNQKKKEMEQKIVHWQNEQSVLKCFLCLQDFTFTLRKHHCRLCGRVVCGSERTQCSRDLPFNILAEYISESSTDVYPIRVCRDCKGVLTAKHLFINDLRKPLSPLLEKFEHQQRIKTAILFLLPRFQKLIHDLQHSETFDTNLIRETSKQRKRLAESFSEFDKLTKEMINLQTDLLDGQRIQQSIKAESYTFIQTNMTPLKQLPRIMKQIEQKQKENKVVRLNHQEIQQIKKMREELMVLNEQKFLVEEMISNAKKQRKFDEIATLNQNLKDLEKIIADLQIDLGNEGF